MQYKMEKNIQDCFSSRLRMLRGESTLTDFASKLEVSFQTYHHYESGTRKPTIDLIMRVVRQCGVSSDWLLGIESESQSNIETNQNGLKQKLTDLKNDAACIAKVANELLSRIEKMKKGL